MSTSSPPSSPSPDPPRTPSGDETHTPSISLLRGSTSETGFRRSTSPPDKADRLHSQQPGAVVYRVGKKKTRRSVSDTQPPPLWKLIETGGGGFSSSRAEAMVRSTSELNNLSNVMVRSSSISDMARKQASASTTLESLDYHLFLELMNQLGSGDWRRLAVAYGLDDDEIEKLEADREMQPASALLKRMMRANMAIDLFASLLERIGRSDLVDLVASRMGGTNGFGETASSKQDTTNTMTRSLSRMGDSLKGLCRIAVTPPASPVSSRRSFPPVAATATGEALVTTPSPRKNAVGITSNSLPRSSSPLTAFSPRPKMGSRAFSMGTVDWSTPSKSFPKPSRLSDSSFDSFSTDGVIKLALVIGNESYDLESLQLSTPVHDAKTIANLLKSFGWHVKYSINADSATLKKDLSFFVSHCLDELNVAAVIFYAGHAVQIGNENFLLPVDISSLRTSAFIQHCAGNISQTLMSLSICSSVITVLNACYPISDWAGLPGLCALDVTSRSFVLYPCPPGQVVESPSALDEASKCSLFISNLACVIENSPDLPLSGVLRNLSGSSYYTSCRSQSLLNQFSLSCAFKETPSSLISSRHALLIRNSTGYASRTEKGHAVEDMTNLSKFLRDKDWNVTFVTDATSTELLGSVNDFLLNPEVREENSLVMIFYLGRVHQSDTGIASVMGTDVSSSEVPVQVLTAMMEEHVTGPKIVVAGGLWNIDYEDLRFSANLFLSQNSLVSYFVNNVEPKGRYVSQLLERWEGEFGSYLSLFDSSSTSIMSHCLFTS
ncbi:uncharacterized protein [Oscarella lobularis]|uniref:uncharacterized protein n=1 Tax=Oscarella lobularis TaxID=121494 RepID=UPI003313346E